MGHTKKFDEASKTFETRLLFINEIFTDTYSRDQIMASCIGHKLDASFEVYLKDIHKSLWKLSNKDPLKILKRID